MRKNVVDVDMKIKFRNNKYCQVSITIVTKCIIIYQYVGFPGEGYDFSFTVFHNVSNAPNTNRVNIVFVY
jgi:hypothetical protein